MSKVQGVCVCALGHTVEWCRVVRYGVQFVEWWAAQEPSPAPTEPENVLQYATFWVRPDARLIDMLVTLVAAEHHVLAAAGPRVPGPAVDRETTDLSGPSRLHRGDSSFEQGPRRQPRGVAVALGWFLLLTLAQGVAGGLIGQNLVDPQKAELPEPYDATTGFDENSLRARLQTNAPMVSPVSTRSMTSSSSRPSACRRREPG